MQKFSTRFGAFKSDEMKVDELRHALIEGEKSGRAEYSLDSFIDELDDE